MQLNPLNQPNIPKSGFFSKIRNKIKESEIYFKKIEYFTKQVYYTLSGNTEKVDQLKSKIIFLNDALQNKLDLSDRTVVQAVNLPRLSVLDKPEKYTSQAEIIGEGIFTEEQLRFGSPRITAGVCWGACIDFARRLQEAKTNQNFSINVIEVAKKFRYGVGKMGVAAQMCYSKTFQIPQTTQSVQISPEEQHLKSVLEQILLHAHPRIDYDGIQGFSQLPDKIQDYIRSIRVDLMLEANRQYSKQLYEPEKFISIAENILKEDKDQLLPFFLPMIQSFIPEAPAGTKAQQGILSQNRIMPLNQPSSSLDMKKLIAKKYGLDLHNPQEMKITLTTGEGTIESYEKINLYELEDGVHLCSFSAQKRTSHAILFMKNGDKMFFWDPNKGLIPCKPNENPSLVLHNLMQIYNSTYYFDSEPNNRPQQNIILFFALKELQPERGST